MNKKILITGGAGYIGSVLVPMLLDEDYEVVLIDKLIFGQKIFSHKKNFKFIKADVRDYVLMKKILDDHNIKNNVIASNIDYVLIPSNYLNIT